MAHRVLIIHPALAPYRVDLFNALARVCRLRVVFLLPNVDHQSFDQVYLRSLLQADFGYPSRTLRFWGRSMPVGLAHEIRAFGPEVVVTSEFSPVTLSLIALRRASSRPFAHVVWTDDNPASITRDGWLRRVSRLVVLSRIDGLVVHSRDIASLYRRRFRTALPIGISPLLHDEAVLRERIAMAAEAADAAVEAHGLRSKRVILYVGRLAREKRVHRIISAFAEAYPTSNDVVLVIVGDGPERDALLRLAQSTATKHRIVFAGRREGATLYAWYRIASLFVLASDHEPFGAVINEALAAGVPVVCSDRAGASSLVRQGITGTIVDASLNEQLVSALRNWLPKTPPSPQRDALRNSLMSIRFQDSVDGFVAALSAARSRARRG